MIKAKFKDTPLEEFVDLPLKDFPNYKINKNTPSGKKTPVGVKF